MLQSGQTDSDTPGTPRRATTIYGRVRDAVRRQDALAILIEIGIVVLGVVIGFQITAWTQARADAAREAGYLVQLENDLRETLRRVEDADASSSVFLRSEVKLLRAYRARQPPPDDSVLTWFSRSFNEDRAAPVIATAEALVATGDLSLIQDDALRRAIPAYLGQTQATQEAVDLYTTEHLRATREATQLVDFWDIAGQIVPQDMIDSRARTDDTWGLPAGPRARPFPARAAAVLGDREIYNAVFYAHVTQYNLLEQRTDMREDAEHLLALVEAARGTAPETSTAANPTAP